MRIIVCVKQVVDLEQVRMDKSTREPILKDVPLVIGQIEKNALEEAARIKASNQAEVIALSVGHSLSEEVTLEILAMGADRDVMLVDPALQGLSGQGMARVIAKAIQKIGGYDLILLGEGSTDNNSGQTGPVISRILGLPLVAYARKLHILNGKIRVTRSLEDYFETVEAPMPAVVTVTAEINEPQIPSIIQVMDASSKPQDKWSLTDIGLTENELKLYTSVRMLRNKYPEQSRKQIVFKGELNKSLGQLVESLTKDGVLDN